MGLFGRKRTSIGLDIGSGFVKVVEVDHSGDQPEVVRVAMRPLLPDAIVEGEIMDYGLVSDSVMGLFQDMGLKNPDVVTAIGGHDVIIKKIEMDRMKESDAREVIRWEAEQHVPFDIKSVELDFQILDPTGDSRQMEVLLVAAKRELVDNKVGLLQDAGVNPIVIDVDAFALHNAFEHNYPDDRDGIIALVNVGHETTNVNILEDGPLSWSEDTRPASWLAERGLPEDELSIKPQRFHIGGTAGGYRHCWHPGGDATPCYSSCTRVCTHDAV
jgi:type IV pilus assembly protein PilM